MFVVRNNFKKGWEKWHDAVLHTQNSKIKGKERRLLHRLLLGINKKGGGRKSEQCYTEQES